MKRGDIVVASLAGDYGKPRPYIVIQSDAFNAKHPSIVLCPLSSELCDATLYRITVEPTARNGLKRISQIMADKPQYAKREDCSNPIGVLDKEQMTRLDDALLMFLGLG